LRILSVSSIPLWDVEDGKGIPSLYLGQKAFVDAGHQVMFAYAGRRRARFIYHGIQMVEFPLRFPAVSPRHLWVTRVLERLRWGVFVPVAVVEGWRLIREFHPDVIYGHAYHAAPVAWLLGRSAGIPNITRLYGTFLFPYVHSRLGRLAKLHEVLAFRTPCRYLIVTDDGTQGDRVAVALGVPASRLRFWRNGVNRDLCEHAADPVQTKRDLGVPTDHKIILAVSRLVRWKRVDRLIAAMPAVTRAVPGVTAVVVGDGEERANLEALARQVGVADRLRFVGLVSHREIPRFLAAADIFVSLYEISNLGNPLLEALSCGRCVVSINNGATGEINLDGEVAVLLDESALQDLPAVLIELLRNDERRAGLGRRGRAYAAAHLRTWSERMAMEVELIEALGPADNRHARVG
jgi:glycosyltransferase involved in cell wall biosynthesis